MTPVVFHQSAGLWLVSTVIARRLMVPMPFGQIYPNLFIVWVAPTTLYRKTTALNVARGIAQGTFPYLLAPQDTTPEAFLADLAGVEPPNFDELPELDQKEWRMSRNHAAQRGLVLDEMSGLLSASGKDYNAGLIEAIIRLYDCDPRFSRSTRRDGRIVLRNGYLSLLGASTTAAMGPHLRSQPLWYKGWWPRFAILTPSDDRPEWRVPWEQSEPAGMVATLAKLHKRLPQATWPDPPKALVTTLGDGVYDAWMLYNKALSHDLLTPDLDDRLAGTYGRLPTLVLKVATILAALDWTEGKAPQIELRHLARAITICEECRASAHRVLTMITETTHDRLSARILGQLGKFGKKGATLRDVYRGMHNVDRHQIEGLLGQMVKAGEVESVEPERAGPGRPTVRYRVMTEWAISAIMSSYMTEISDRT